MTASLLEDSLAVAIIDALTSQICVVDPDGVIFAVNRAWKKYSASNAQGPDITYIGVNYFDICRRSVGPASEGAPDFMDGLRAVLGGERDRFEIEYPCHSPDVQRWFVARVSPLHYRSPAIADKIFGAVISHADITDRKLVELDHARLAATDPLTGIPNRRFFDEFARLEIERLARFGNPTSLLLLDIDRFKGVNDAYGHVVGDDVLRRVAALGGTVFRKSDLFARLGGDEFVCLLPGTDESGALEASEKLRAAIERLRFVVGATTISVTASIGVIAMGRDDRTLDGALIRADRALYRAKHSGRNCVKTFVLPAEAAAAS